MTFYGQQMEILHLQPRDSQLLLDPVVNETGEKRYLVWTIGCQMNEAESAKVEAMLNEAGYRATNNEDAANIIVLNSCVVRQASEDKVAGKIGSLARVKRERPDTKIAVTGCMVTGQEKDLSQRFPWVDLFFEPSDFDSMATIVPELESVDTDLTNLPHYYQDESADPRVTAFVPIIYGCNFLCSYCIVPYRRGKEVSRPLEDIVAEVSRISQGGVQEVTLLGQTVNAYGHDLPSGYDLADLLEAVDAIPRIERVRFLTSHPKYFSDKLIHAMADLQTVCEHVNLPVQSGDNEVLRRMRRTYTVEHYRDRIETIRNVVPGVTISTDIIVGFPGETDEQFENTVQLLQDIEFDKVHVAMYSPRPRTLSSRWDDDVPHETKHARHQIIESIQEKISHKRHLEQVGQRQEILVDGFAKGRWRGRTRGNGLVFFESTGDWTGQLVDVELTNASTWYMLAEPVAVLT